MTLNYPLASISQVFTSFVAGLREVDGGELNQLIDMLFIPRTGLIAHAGGGQNIDANNQLKYGFNQIKTVATDADSVILPMAIPGGLVIVDSIGAAAHFVIGQPQNPANANAGDTIAPVGSVAQTATAMGVEQEAGQVGIYYCYVLGQWKQMLGTTTAP